MTKRHVRQPASAPGAQPPLPTFSGTGLQAGLDLDDSANLLELMQQGDAPRPAPPAGRAAR